VSAFDRLFEPTKIGGVEVKNKLAFAPTDMGTCDMDGSINDQILSHYIARAKGGVGWITVEHTLVTYKYATGLSHLVGFYSDRQINRMKELADCIHAFDVKAVVQLSLGAGRQGYATDEKELVAPSAIPYHIPAGSAPRGLKFLEGYGGETPRALTTEEAEELEDLFVATAMRVKRAGFEGIELHGAHGYLLSQFVSPLSNQRQDKYGGSFEKRLTMPINLIKKTRKAVGEDFLIGYRISCNEHLDGGLTLQDTKNIISELEKAGIDFLELTSGSYAAFHWTLPENEGVVLEEAGDLKKSVKVPIICPNVHTPQLAVKILEEGRADMISLSRGLIADPDWPNKVREGRINEIQKCILCNTCVWCVFNGYNVKCVVNPNASRERYMPEYFPPPIPIKRSEF
jgi:2,4-dienoyl-CoA reductase-like NADH-dependent reductase (Old Yellow Enzyme family)